MQYTVGQRIRTLCAIECTADRNLWAYRMGVGRDEFQDLIENKKLVTDISSNGLSYAKCLAFAFKNDLQKSDHNYWINLSTIG